MELAGVFATLAPTIAEATRLVEEARAEAEARRLKAMAEAQALSADARSQIEAVRSAAAAGCLRLLADERAAAAATAKAEVERIQRTAEARLPGLVVRVMNDVRATASGSAVVGTDAQLAAGRRS